ncbi:DUF504 domain-containing protein [Methanolobus vulcani]|uniref:DUF504 domain-containing protein n=1 Tax=Methanolobus vulcani TaxID=38026 RepID=A0A7Z8P103_9EURY|nr:RNA repair domain-containing protein [Methanolobus vulcani]TQD23394.1 DUF504 domain-containing protein [Methanolobus vulcani]
MSNIIKSKHPRDIFSELKWKENLDINEYSVEYIHIGAPRNTKTDSLDAIVSIGHLFFTLIPDTMIPYHRILQIKYKGKTIYVKTEP